MQVQAVTISEMEHCLMKQGLSWRHGSVYLKWNGCEDHWCRESPANKKRGCSLKGLMITAVTPDNVRNRGRKKDASDAKIYNE